MIRIRFSWVFWNEVKYVWHKFLLVSFWSKYPGLILCTCCAQYPRRCPSLFFSDIFLLQKPQIYLDCPDIHTSCMSCLSRICHESIINQTSGLLGGRIWVFIRGSWIAYNYYNYVVQNGINILKISFFANSFSFSIQSFSIRKENCNGFYSFGVETNQLTFTYSKSIIETLEKDMKWKYVQSFDS